MKKQSIWLILSLMALFVLLAIPVLAQEPSFDEVNDVAGKMNCPTCQSLNLADCRTQTCQQWRDQIKDMLAEGMEQQEILDWYAERYGDEVLQEPPRRGVGLYVWVLPVIGFLLGAIWLIVILKKWSSANPVAVPAANAPSPADGESTNAEPDDDYLKKVEQDLKNL